MKFTSLLIITLLFNILQAEENITIIPPQSNSDISHNYFSKILKESLEDDSRKVNILHSKEMSQERALIELKKNRTIDVMWTGTSIKREKDLRAIKIPLLKGLLGYRVFIINKEDEKKFNKINTIEELKELRACQGAQWPDTEILEKSGLNVVRNTNYEAMFLQLSIKRCDYFPRGIYEGYSEVEARKDSYPTLMIYDKVILYYPFPMYFFVSKRNEDLALRIEKGLLKMIDNGNFDTYLKENSSTKYLYSTNKWQNRKIFKISNPLLSPLTDITNTKFWIVPKF
ncbi:MAG: hypothetical protein CL623_09940 [Arcobacter sp.]|nr:hypothetical protein [Arcobacter sp.]